MCGDIAALLNPMPVLAENGDESDDESYSHAAGAAWQEREEMAEDLRTGWPEGDIDPLLSTLSSLRNRRLQLEAEMRLLIAYGRCFTHPRPYKLIDLANAEGMSTRAPRSSSSLWVPIIHPCWSGSMPVLVEDAAEAVASVDVEAGGSGRLGDR